MEVWLLAVCATLYQKLVRYQEQWPQIRHNPQGMKPKYLIYARRSPDERDDLKPYWWSESKL